MPILVTGFEPFGGSSRNASWEAVSLLPETIAGHAVYRMRLPVCYGQAGDLLVEMMRRIRPTVTLCCGVAGGRKAITPELIAVNYRRAAIADNADVLYAGEKIDPKRPDAHMTRLNVLRMVDAMKSAELPADLSLTAGAYVCNDLYFALLDRGLTIGGEGVFVHVPTEDVVSADDAAKGWRFVCERRWRGEADCLFSVGHHNNQQRVLV